MKTNKTKIMIIAVLATIIAGGAILNSCKKDESLTSKTENVSAVKEQKFLYGYFGEAMLTNMSASGGSTKTTLPPCYSTSSIKHFYNYDHYGRITGYEIRTDYFDCKGNLLWSVGYFVELSASRTGTMDDLDAVDVSNIDNFDFYVDNKFVSEAFSYNKTLRYEGEDGVIHYGCFNVTREDVVAVWEEINPQIDWDKRP